MVVSNQVAHEKFTNLRRRLDQFGYKQPLGLDSLPLVERLFCDLVWTTENLKKMKSDLSSQIKIRGKVEDYVAPYKADNGRLVHENNEMNQHIISIRSDYEEKFRGLKAEFRRSESKIEDLKYFNSQCLEKIKSYEREAQRMVEQILLLQEKNFQAVVYTPTGNKKQLPFRRQRMDIDALVPPNKHLKHKENYCCCVSELWSTTGRNLEPQAIDLLNLATQRCAHLEKQVKNLEEEIELCERKVENFRKQVTLRDSEIDRLRSLTESGRPLEALLNASADKPNDRVIEQLEIQVNLLQTRNEELESRVLDLINREICHPQSPQDCQSCEIQTPCSAPTTAAKKANASCQTFSVLFASQSFNGMITNENLESIRLFCTNCSTLFKQFATGRQHLSQNMDQLLRKERELIGHFVKPDCFGKPPPKTLTRRSMLNELKHAWSTIEQDMSNLKDEHNRWLLDGQKLIDLIEPKLMHILDVESDNRATSEDVEDGVGERCEDDKQISRDQLVQLELERDCYLDKLQQLKEQLNTNNSHNQEMKHLRSERNHLVALLNCFECQVRSIQSNIHLLTQERDKLKDQLTQSQNEIVALNDCLAQANAPTNIQHLDIEQQHQQQLDAVRAEMGSIIDERDRLNRQIDALNNNHLSDRQRLIKLVDEKTEELKIGQEKQELVQNRVAELTQVVANLETERNRLLERNNCLSQMEEEKKNAEVVVQEMDKVKTQLDKIQIDLDKSHDECNRLRLTCRQLDHEKDQLQSSLDERTERCVVVEKEYAKREVQLNDSQRTNEVLEKRLMRLTQTIVERENECQRMTSRMSKLDVEVDQLLKSKDLISCQLETSKNDMCTMVNEIDRLESEVNDCRSKEVTSNKRLNELDRELNNVRGLCKSKEQEHSDFLNQYRLLSIENDERAALIGRLESQLEESNHTCLVRGENEASLSQQLESSRKSCAEFEQVVTTLESQCRLLSLTLAETEDRLKRLQTENKETCRELTETRSLCDRLERKLHTSQHQITMGSLETSQLNANLTENERELNALRKQLDYERETVRNLEFVLETSREADYKSHAEIRKYQSELQSLRERLETRESRLIESENEIKKLNNRLISFQLDYSNSVGIRPQQQKHPMMLTDVVHLSRQSKATGLSNAVTASLSKSTDLGKFVNLDDLSSKGLVPTTIELFNCNSHDPMTLHGIESLCDFGSFNEDTLIPQWTNLSIQSSNCTDMLFNATDQSQLSIGTNATSMHNNILSTNSPIPCTSSVPLSLPHRHGGKSTDERANDHDDDNRLESNLEDSGNAQSPLSTLSIQPGICV